MEKSSSASYKAAGVDIEAGYEAVARIKKLVAKTYETVEGADFDGSAFAGLLPLTDHGLERPYLVSSTDGVGTKLKLAFLMDKHDTVGIDCVAMCVNDLVCSGAKPINFLDYIACGKNDPDKIEQIVKGVVAGCIASGIPLVGGETAEMPGFYPENEYDLAGFANGLVDRDKIIDKSAVKPGDKIIGLASSGVHSNGFSLVRKIFQIDNVQVLNAAHEELGGKKLGQVLLEPTKIYVKPVLKLLEKNLLKSLAHITGGGFYENIPRALPADCMARVYKDRVPVLPIFELLQKEGGISEKDMYNTFNMGIGLVMVIAADREDQVQAILSGYGERVYDLGQVEAGPNGLQLV